MARQEGHMRSFVTFTLRNERLATLPASAAAFPAAWALCLILFSIEQKNVSGILLFTT